MITITSIKTKFFLSIISVTLFVSIFLLVFFVNRSDHLIEEELTELGFSLVRNLAYSSQLPVASEDVILLRPYLSGIAEEVDVVFAAVYNKRGKLITSSKKLDLDERISEAIQNEISAKRNIIQAKGFVKPGGVVHNFYSPIYVADIFDLTPRADEKKKLGGFARIVLSTERVRMQRRTILTLGLGITLLVLFCSLGLSYLLSRKIVGPILKLTENVKVIGKGGLNHDVAVNSNDEIGELGAAFNKMTGELKAAQEQLVLKEKLAAVGQMSSVIAHDLRNPLAAIRNIGYMFTKLKSADERIAKFSDLLVRESDAANKIVTDLLDFSRTRPPNKVVCSLDGVIDDALRTLFLKESVKVVKDLSPTLKVNIDPDPMKRAFLNIMNNAVQAMPDGGTLTISALAVENGVKISIGDTGSGIDPETLKRIFEPFFTTKTKGTGLGMPIILNIVTQHGGKINVESTVGRGTTVHIELPS